MTVLSRIIRFNLADPYPYVKRQAMWRDKLLGDPISVWVVERIWTWTWLSPTAVTLLSFLLAIFACYAFALGGWFLTLGAILWEIAHWLDCVDGKLARKTRNFSKVGAWLDKNLDRVKRISAMLCLIYSCGDNWPVLLAAYLIIVLSRRIKKMANPRVDGWLQEVSVLSVFDAQDETLMIFTVGPLLQVPLLGAVLALAGQTGDRLARRVIEPSLRSLDGSNGAQSSN